MGKYKSDCTLPSINKLSREYQVSRDTVFKAFIDLKDRGIIDSTPGKGYYVTNKLTNILLLLDEYSPFKYSLYNSFIKKLSINYKVDLLFHQYNERLFNTILRESIGRYNKYIVMNFDNEKLSPHLYKIDSSKLLLLDFGKFDKKDYSYVCQDFDDSFYHALAALKEHLRKYQRLVLLFPEDIKHAGCCGSPAPAAPASGRTSSRCSSPAASGSASPHSTGGWQRPRPGCPARSGRSGGALSFIFIFIFFHAILIL